MLGLTPPAISASNDVRAESDGSRGANMANTNNWGRINAGSLQMVGPDRGFVVRTRIQRINSVLPFKL